MVEAFGEECGPGEVAVGAGVGSGASAGRSRRGVRPWLCVRRTPKGRRRANGRREVLFAGFAGDAAGSMSAIEDLGAFDGGDEGGLGVVLPGHHEPEGVRVGGVEGLLDGACAFGRRGRRRTGRLPGRFPCRRCLVSPKSSRWCL